MKHLRTKLLVGDVVDILLQVEQGARIVLASDEERNQIYSDLFFEYDERTNTVTILGWGDYEQETISELREQSELKTQQFNKDFKL